VATVSRGPRIVREPVAESINRLETFVARMEHRYEVSSEEMLEAVCAGTARETAEVGRWLAAYRDLANLRQADGRGHADGSRTSSTR
jgi:hypothetical protein